MFFSSIIGSDYYGGPVIVYIRRTYIRDRHRTRRCTVRLIPCPMLRTSSRTILDAWPTFHLFSCRRMSLLIVCRITYDRPQRLPLPKKRIGERRAAWTLTGAFCPLSPASTSSARPCPTTTLEKTPHMFTRGTPPCSPRIIFPPASQDSVRHTDHHF